MNNIHVTSGEVFSSSNLLIGSPAQTSYQRKNLIIEKPASIGWVSELYKGSVLHSFWTVLTSPMD